MKQIKTLFKIYTPYGNCYTVNELGQIGRTDMPFTPSDSWKIQGIASVKSNAFMPFNKITKENIATLQLLYKNGNPRFTVRDLDHGTTREWGNTKAHGIKSIQFL